MVLKFFAIIALMVMALTITGNAQDKFTLSGYVRDAENGEELIGVTLFISELNKGAVTNVYGFYSLTLAPGTYTLTLRYIGFKTKQVKMDVTANLSYNFDMISELIAMKEVVVFAEAVDANVSDISMSKVDLNIGQIKKLPALLGEPDLLKTIQMLPGVISAGEGTSAYFVRGGSSDQNLILIDEAPIYDPSHLFGFLSIFNSDAIKGSELYKGGIPAKYGGRLSSILDVRTKDGNNKKFSGSFGIGSIASRMLIEGPLRKDRSSFLVSARRSYVDVFLALANNNNRVYFYDINAKINWKGQNNNRFFVTVYSGRDAFILDQDFGFDWGNTTATIRWNHLFNEKLFSNTSLIVSNFDYGLELTDPVLGFLWTSTIQEFSFKEDLTYYVSPDNELNFGYHLSYHKFLPGKITPNASSSIFSTVELEKLFALDHAFYLENQRKLSNKLLIRYGVRLSVFQNVGASTIYTYEDPKDNINIRITEAITYGTLEKIISYVNLEPRVSIRYNTGKHASVKLSYNRMVQNVHLISSGTVPLPFNTWYPSYPYLKPQIADQIAGGYFRNFRNNNYEFSVEGYYKWLNNVTDFADNADIFFNPNLSTEFRQGISRSYGLELLLKKNTGFLTGFASYTYSKAERQIEGVNDGNVFVANYDRRNAFNVLGTYEFNRKWTFGFGFTYGTGRPITLATGKYGVNGYIPDFITERNGFRLPDYHRMDLSATLTSKKNKDRKWKSSWVFSIYNVYNRKNIFTIFTRQPQDDNGDPSGEPGAKEFVAVYLFPVLPSVNYNIRF